MLWDFLGHRHICIVSIISCSDLNMRAILLSNRYRRGQSLRLIKGLVIDLIQVQLFIRQALGVQNASNNKHVSQMITILLILLKFI